MASSINLLIQRGQRRARELRPATLIYGGAEFPCVPGNLDFFERLSGGADGGGGGFDPFNGLHVTMLRADLPPGIEFKRGEKVMVRDEESGDIYDLVVGNNNSRQAAVIILNLEAEV